MSRRSWVVVVFALGLIAAGLGLQWWNRRHVPPAPVVVVAAPPAPPPAVVASGVLLEAPPPSHPVDVPLTATPLAAKDVAPALTNLIGRNAALTFLQTGDFPRRMVATIDNLGRSHAPSQLWPVNPMAGRFQVSERQDGTVIGLDNSLRYTPFVRMVESVDVASAAALYLRLYPLLQRAYEDLGFPKRQFNDRVVQVIDQLLATPEAAQHEPVQLTEVKGPIASTRPWVRYEFVDPKLQALTAGQKIMLRVGPVNQRRLKARLVAFRAELTRR